ncbi:hypothetical protein ABZ464_28600 [Streptomyces sp. NPDC005820]|uniref:hypothetical protein n=1 Tax=Streptomyces sp. NPDC005820 TaxID=3157069 RepID=UPI0033D00E2F
MTGTPVDDAQVETSRLWAAPRGRHRRPRPRKVLFAAGGLALAAGVLSLVRMSSGPSGVTGIGTAEAEPRPDPVTGADTATDHAANAGATVAATPPPPSAMGAASAEPAPEVSLVPGTPGAPTSVALTPGASYTPAPSHPPAPAPTRTAAPRPTPTPPPPPAPAPALTPPQPEQTRQPGVCVPVVGLCVDPLNLTSGP